MGHFGLDRGLVVTLNHSKTMSVDEGVIEFVPYRIWALQRMKGTQDKTSWSDVCTYGATLARP
ncbi:MAG: hypothetical protein K8R34_07880 [Methanosarcinales archaeon]|nr:hypothetical protein [Methanosarcinales archaeon]MCD4799913.1 hypothetical protein [Methanosarcinales archaeon]MCD4808884.1 hypothetical protein [Methanosarcinales archaeon]